MAARGRVANADVLRALAALAVLGVHAYAFGGRAAPIRAQHLYDVPLINLASAVWLFFGLSGYVISRPFVDRLVDGRPLPAAVPYALRRALRIFPLYWIALTALIAIDGTTGTHPWQLPFHYLLLNNLIPGRQEALFSPAWTLTLELLFYIAVPVLAAAARGSRRTISPERLAALVICSWALSIAFTAFADLQGDGQTGLWLRAALPAMWQMFCPGILLAIAPHLREGVGRRWLVKLPRRRSAAVLAVAALIAGAVLGASAPLRFGIVPYQLMVDASRPLFAIGYGLLLAAAIRARPWAGGAPWLLELGLISYGIYLLHPVIEAFMLREGLVPAGRNTLGAFALNTACLVAVTIPVALLSWRWLERPAIAFGRGLGERWLGQRDASARSSTIRAVAPAHTTAKLTVEDIRHFWNDRAREDAFYFVDTRQAYRAPDPQRFWESADLVDYLLDGLGVKLRATDVVLEIGCGIGRITRGLAARAGEVVALDVSDEMLTRARALNPHLDHVRWVLGDGESLDGIPDASIDACVSVVVLQHVPDPAITLNYVREVGRVLRPGGWAALQASNDPELHRARDGLVLRAKARVGLAPKGQRHPAWLGSHVEIEDVRAAASDGGLEVEKVWGAGTQYCQILLRRPRGAGG